MEVRRALGPGLLESAHRQCLAHELVLVQSPFQMEHPIPATYKGLRLDCGYRADLLVDGSLLVELKSVENLLPVHQAQVLTYMALAHVRVGLLMNFNVRMLKDGIRRFVL